jgi:putative transposase
MGCRERFMSTMPRSFTPKRWRAAARSMASVLTTRPPGRPHFGGHIERLIGTMMGAVHLLPGTTFSNVSEKGSYASEERVLVDTA